VPDGGKIGSEDEQTIAFLLGERAWTLPLAARKLAPCGFERAQALLPLAFEPAGNKPIVGIDGATPIRFLSPCANGAIRLSPIAPYGAG
jgi:hypothetical protein